MNYSFLIPIMFYESFSNWQGNVFGFTWCFQAINGINCFCDVGFNYLNRELLWIFLLFIAFISFFKYHETPFSCFL